MLGGVISFLPSISKFEKKKPNKPLDSRAGELRGPVVYYFDFLVENRSSSLKVM